MGFLRRAKLSDPIAFPFSKRNVVNLSYINDVAHYPFINHVLEADNWVSPVSSSLAGINPSWPEMLDQATGYAIHANASGHSLGGGLKFPDSSKFPGPYVITWDGSGTIDMALATWTETNNVSGQPGFGTYTRNSNGNWTNVAGKSAYIVANITSAFAGAPNLFPIKINATGGPDGFVRNVRVYRLVDEGDLLAGRVFRRPFLQQIVDHDPSVLRVMNWSGGNDAHGMRFENRCLPNYCSYGNDANWVSSPLYGTTTGINQYALNVVTTGVRQTPASITHGEVVICRIGNTSVASTAANTQPTISSISTIATPRVVTSTVHGFATGQTIFHSIPAGSGVPKLDRFPATITVINTTTYDITNLSLVGQAAYTANSGTCYVYMSLNVGNRKVSGDPGAGDYPVVFSPGNVGPGAYGSFYFTAGDLKALYFDKNIVGKSDGAGNYIKGAWIFTDSGPLKGHWDGVPLEVLTKLIIELNQAGPRNPISLWICYPHQGLCSIDPDYTLASNWAVQATNIILNGNTVGGTVWPGLLTGATGANLYIEYCNENWNTIPSSPQAYWHQWYSKSRWGMSVNSGPDAYALRSTAMVRDIKAAYPTETRIKMFMGLWCSKGMSLVGTTQDGAGNHGAWHGSSTPGNIGYLYTTDSTVVSGSWGPPKNWHDGVAIAPYFEAGQIYYTGTGAGSLTDDSAMYAGTAPYAGAPNQTQALTNFINAAVTASDGGPSLNACLVAHDQFASFMGTGQYVVEYEGGGNWATSVNYNLYGHLITPAEEIFMIAAYRCAYMGTTLVNFMNTICAKPKSALPSIFLSVNAGYRWSFGAPDSYGTTSTEGGTLTTCPAWMALNTRNASIT